MIKLYRLAQVPKAYWETWENDDGSHLVHWGRLGTRGNQKTVKDSLLRKAARKVSKEMDEMLAQGFEEIDAGLHQALVVEYAIEGMGTMEDLDKRHRLEDRMNQTLGWTGLGHCDGGSIGNGTMEVFNLVVDFELARAVVEEDLEGTDFSDYLRIYNEMEDLGEAH